MSTTQQRLDAYLAAEAKILARGQSVGFGSRSQQLAELGEIRKAITSLQAEISRENAAARGASGLSYATVDFRCRDR